MSNVHLCTIFLTHDSFKPKLPLNAQRLLHIKYHINSNTNSHLSQQKLDYPLYYDRGFWLNTFTKLRISNKALFNTYYEIIVIIVRCASSTRPPPPPHHVPPPRPHSRYSTPPCLPLQQPMVVCFLGATMGLLAFPPALARASLRPQQRHPRFELYRPCIRLR